MESLNLSGTVEALEQFSKAVVNATFQVSKIVYLIAETVCNGHPKIVHLSNHAAKSRTRKKNKARLIRLTAKKLKETSN